MELAKILGELEQLLTTALNEHEEWFAEDMPSHLREAWPHVQPRITGAIRYLYEPPNPELLDSQLADVGLTEPESVPKKEGWRRAFRRWVRAPSKRALSSALGWMNIILGSLSGLVPGVEAVKEYKEACEQAVEDADEPEPPSPKSPRTPGEFNL
jgi:hypothetical protein